MGTHIEIKLQKKKPLLFSLKRNPDQGYVKMFRNIPAKKKEFRNIKYLHNKRKILIQPGQTIFRVFFSKKTDGSHICSSCPILEYVQELELTATS